MKNEIFDNFEWADIVIKSAAVADYKPKEYSKDKIKNPIYLQRNRDRQMFFRFFYLFRHLKSYFIDAAFFHPLFRRVVLCLNSCKENTLEFYV